MVRLTDLTPTQQEHLRTLDCPGFDTRPFVRGRALKARRIAVVTSAGLLKRGDPLFRGGDPGYRILPTDISPTNVLIGHISVNFDRTGFQEDWNVVLPLDRLRELAHDGVIGSVADWHYSFMGATDPRAMTATAAEVVERLKHDGVDAVLLTPV